MLRQQVSSRNHRWKGGFRAKSALRICILVAVCVWLLYQTKHSHDQRKAYEERWRVDERQSEITRLGRKDLLPEDIEQDTKHENEVAGGAENHRTDGRDKVRAEEGVHTQHIDHKVDRNGTKSGVFEDLEHEEQSHEAREKSFKGDDASSEVVHTSSQDVEHEEQTQEARGRSFKADDASSAVDHVVQVKESKSENGLLDSSKATNSSVVHEDNLTLPKDKVSIKKTEAGVQHTKLEKLPSSTTTAAEADDEMEEQTDLEIVDHIYNETEPQTYSPDESDNQIESEVRLLDSSKNQINLQKNHTAVSEDWTETHRNQPTLGVTARQNQTTLHALPGLNTTTKLEIPGKEKSKTEDAVVVHKKSDQTARPEESEESSKTSSVTGENKKVFPQESKDSSHSGTPKERKR